MPLTSQQGPSCTECFGFTWTVNDEAKLAALVAELLAGRYRYVASLLSGETERGAALPAGVLMSLKARLNPKKPELIYHRDGWLFQMVSWISAHMTLGSHSALLAPHTQPADKGIDTFLVEWNPTNETVAAVTIGEDKATENPRKTVREKVWPELKEWESGARDNELIAATTMVLEAAAVSDPERLVERVFWRGARRYRVAITAPPPDDEAARNELFSGYAAQVSGQIGRRRADVYLTPDVRAWLEAFSIKVIATLEKAAGA